MIKNIVTLGLVTFIALGSMAQEDDKNLVENPSFEIADKIKKLNKLKKIEVANGWSSPTAMKADLYSTEAKEVATIPDNAQGREFPYGAKEGNYAGGIPSGVYNKEKMDLNKIPYLGVKKENKNINYL